MNLDAQGEKRSDSIAGPEGPSFWRPGRRGFTLLEMCIVLLILGILMTVIAPGMQSALAEQKLRSDASQLSLMVKTAMIQSNEEHRAYELDLSESGMSLAPVVPPPAKDPEGSTPVEPKDGDDAQKFTETWKLTQDNQLLLPDPKASGKWQRVESTQWIFRPGELCPASDVLFRRGEAEVQMSFNALTGNVEDERSIFP